MSGKLKTLSLGRRAVPRAGCVAVICRACNAVALRAGIFVFLFVLAPAARSADKTTWSKYDNNVPGASDSICTNGTIPLGTKGDVNAALYPAVIKDDSSYKMWYSGKDGANNWRIYYATSTDGLTWTKKNNVAATNSNTISTDGRIGLGTNGRGDSTSAYIPSVIKDGSTYKMWYVGREGSNFRIYHATSSNGLTWTKKNNVAATNSDTISTDGRIGYGTDGRGDHVIAYAPSIIKDDSLYKMWYSGTDGTNYRTYHATSTDGLTWMKYDNSIPDDSDTTSTNGRVPLGSTSGTGDEKGASLSTVIKDGSTYKMWYIGNDEAESRNRIYYATSTDGLTWTKYDNSIPDNSNTTSTNGRIPRGINGGDINSLQRPCVIKDGYFYKMWYGGYDGTKWRIYHATCDVLPEGIIFYSH